VQRAGRILRGQEAAIRLPAPRTATTGGY